MPEADNRIYTVSKGGNSHIKILASVLLLPVYNHCRLWYFLLPNTILVFHQCYLTINTNNYETFFFTPLIDFYFFRL